VVVCFLVIVTLVILPGQLSELGRIMSSISKYRLNFIPSSEETHVIVAGRQLSKNKLETFFREFFCEDRVATTGANFFVVILSNEEPSGERP